MMVSMCVWHGPHVDRDELYKECVTALERGALLESQDLSEAKGQPSLVPSCRQINDFLSWYALGCLMYSVCGIKHNW